MIGRARTSRVHRLFEWNGLLATDIKSRSLCMPRPECTDIQNHSGSRPSLAHRYVLRHRTTAIASGHPVHFAHSAETV